VVQPRADAPLRGRRGHRLSLPPPLALALIEGLIEREFDVAAVAGLAGEQHEGHAYSFVHRWYLNGNGARMLPVVSDFPTTPTIRPTPRCRNAAYGLGKSLKELIEGYPEDLKVGLIASGGLSHFVVEEDLDRCDHRGLAEEGPGFLAGLDPRRLKAGSSEIRNWIVVGGAPPPTSLELDFLHALISHAGAERESARLRQMGLM